MRLPSFSPPTYRFKGYWDYVTDTRSEPVGRDKTPLKIKSVEPGRFQILERISSVFHLRFDDDSEAYFRPAYKCHYHLMDVGASILGRQLQLGIFPKTELASLQVAAEDDEGKVEVPSGNLKINVPTELFKLGSIQAGIKGKRIDRLEDVNILERVLERSDRLFELYLYMIVAYDTDRVSRNIVIDDQSAELWSVDNNMLDGQFSYFLPGMGLDFPEELKPFLKRKQPLPENYQAKLRNFLAHKKENRRELSPYYSQEAIGRMFERAQFILDNPVVMPLKQVRKKLGQLEARKSRPLYPILRLFESLGQLLKRW